jgi:hypothetical protein
MTHARTAPSSARPTTLPPEVPSRFLAVVPTPDPPLSHAPLEECLGMCIAFQVFEPRAQAAVMTAPRLLVCVRDGGSSVRVRGGTSIGRAGASRTTRH